MDLDPRPDAIRPSSSDPDVVETQLLLPIRLFLALESAARQHNLTAGQMARVLIARALRAADSPSIES